MRNHITTGIQVNLFNALKFILITLLLAPLLEWCIAKYHSRAWTHELRSGKTIQLSRGRLGPWALHNEFNAGSRRARLLNVLLAAAFVSIGLIVELGFSAEKAFVNSRGDVLERYGVESFSIPTATGFRLDEEDLFYISTSCAGRRVTSLPRRCEAGRENNTLSFKQDVSFLKGNSSRAEFLHPNPGNTNRTVPTAHIDVGSPGEVPEFKLIDDCVCAYPWQAANFPFYGCTCLRDGHLYISRITLAPDIDPRFMKFNISSVRIGSIGNTDHGMDVALLAMALAQRVHKTELSAIGPVPWRRILGTLEIAAVKKPLYRVQDQSQDKLVTQNVDIQARPVEVATVSYWTLAILLLFSAPAIIYFAVIRLWRDDLSISIESMYRRVCWKLSNPNYDFETIPDEPPLILLTPNGELRSAYLRHESYRRDLRHDSYQRDTSMENSEPEVLG